MKALLYSLTVAAVKSSGHSKDNLYYVQAHLTPLPQSPVCLISELD